MYEEKRKDGKLLSDSVEVVEIVERVVPSQPPSLGRGTQNYFFGSQLPPIWDWLGDIEDIDGLNVGEMVTSKPMATTRHQLQVWLLHK